MQEWKKDRIYYNMTLLEKQSKYNEFLDKFLKGKNCDEYKQEIKNKDLFEKKQGQDWAITREGLASLYALVRKHKPKLIVETGVHYGLSSAIFLSALKANNKGKLISIDSCTQDADMVGCYIPEDLKDRWKFIKGKSCDVLPTFPKDLGRVDMFCHDSLHKYDNMMFEYEWAYKHINKGLIITHDIGASNAFFDFAKKYKLKVYLIKTSAIQQFGLGIVSKE